MGKLEYVSTDRVCSDRKHQQHLEISTPHRVGPGESISEPLNIIILFQFKV